LVIGKQTRNPEREEQIKELLIKGMSMNKIAEELGVSIGTVQYWKKKIGPVENSLAKRQRRCEGIEKFLRTSPTKPQNPIVIRFGHYQ
jgi:uncharacterized protein YjcR